MQKLCVCSKPIRPKFWFCAECQAKYGDDREQWPEYVVFMVKDINREWMSEMDWAKRHGKQVSWKDYETLQTGNYHGNRSKEHGPYSDTN